MRIAIEGRNQQTGEWEENVLPIPLANDGDMRPVVIHLADDATFPQLSIQVRGNGDVELTYSATGVADSLAVIPRSSNSVRLRPVAFNG